MSRFKANHGRKRRHHGTDEKRDLIADYSEWAGHRYTPGYFAGGRLGPGIRAAQNMFSRREKRVILVVLGGALVMAVVFIAERLVP